MALNTLSSNAAVRSVERLKSVEDEIEKEYLKY